MADPQEQRAGCDCFLPHTNGNDSVVADFNAIESRAKANLAAERLDCCPNPATNRGNPVAPQVRSSIGQDVGLTTVIHKCAQDVEHERMIDARVELSIAVSAGAAFA